MLKKWKRRFLPYIIAYSVKITTRLLLRTCRLRIHGLETFKATANASPCILMMWHDKIIIAPEILSRYTKDYSCTVLISKSRDADALALAVESYPQARALRVPHDARHQALAQMIYALKRKKEMVLITPDGPRGPRHEIKPGIVVAAKETSAPVVPFSWKAEKFWQLKTWDKMHIPKPFTTIHVTFGHSVTLSNPEMSIEQDTETLKNALKAFNHY